MSKNKYQQIMEKSKNIEITYRDMKIETYHRLAYISCVKEENDIIEIDKIFNFINENYSFFSQLTKNRQLSAWVYQHVFQLLNSTSEIDYPDIFTKNDYCELIIKDFKNVINVDYDSLSNALFSIPQYISNIVEDLNLNIIGDNCLSNVCGLKKLAEKYAMKDLYDACEDLDTYLQYFDDMDEIIRLFRIVDIQSYKILQFINRLEK